MGNSFGCYKTNKLDTVTSPTSDGTDSFTNFDASEKQHAKSANQFARESAKPNLTADKQEIVIANNTKTSVDQTAPLDSEDGVTFDEENGH